MLETLDLRNAWSFYTKNQVVEPKALSEFGVGDKKSLTSDLSSIWGAQADLGNTTKGRNIGAQVDLSTA